jgi:hypothetical protein
MRAMSFCARSRNLTRCDCAPGARCVATGMGGRNRGNGARHAEVRLRPRLHRCKHYSPAAGNVREAPNKPVRLVTDVYAVCAGLRQLVSRRPPPTQSSRASQFVLQRVESPPETEPRLCRDALGRRTPLRQAQAPDTRPASAMTLKAAVLVAAIGERGSERVVTKRHHPLHHCA